MRRPRVFSAITVSSTLAGLRELNVALSWSALVLIWTSRLETGLRRAMAR